LASWKWHLVEVRRLKLLVDNVMILFGIDFSKVLF